MDKINEKLKDHYIRHGLWEKLMDNEYYWSKVAIERYAPMTRYYMGRCLWGQKEGNDELQRSKVHWLALGNINSEGYLEDKS